MDIKELLPKDTEGRLRIIQETVPGRQITLAHVITSPKPIVYRKLGLNPDIDFDRSAIGIITVTPSESAVIGAERSKSISGFSPNLRYTIGLGLVIT